MERNFLYEEESFIDTTVGNFLDYIHNSIYNFQKYIDLFYNDINSVYDILDETDDANMKNVIKFLALENENIIKQKCASFVSNIYYVMLKKHDQFLKIINDCDNSNLIYQITEDGYIYIDNFFHEIEWNRICVNEYSKKGEKTEDMYDVISFMNNEFNKYNDLNFSTNERELSKEQISIIINSIFMKIIFNLVQLKKLTEEASSVYSAVVTCRLVISSMIILYYILKTLVITQGK